MSAIRRMMMRATGGGILPSGYTLLDYVQGTGDKSLSTGITMQPDDIIMIDVMDDATIQNTNLILWCFSSAGGAWCGMNALGYWALSASIYLPIKTQQRSVLKIYYNNGLNLESGEFSVRIGYAGSLKKWSLFGYRNSYFVKAKIYDLKVIRDGIVSVHFIPCSDSENHIGFYDIIGQQFYKYY